MKSITKSIVLAGGLGSRLLPLTRFMNKHTLHVGGVPMLYHPIRTVKALGVKEIVVILGGNSIGLIPEMICSEPEFKDLEFSFKFQREPLGIAHAIGLTESIIGKSDFLTILGDNIFSKVPERFASCMMKKGCSILLKEVNDPERFGNPIFNKKKELVDIVEKPENPSNKYAVTGLYKFNHDAFDIIKTLKPSPRGQYEVTDIIRHYIINKDVICSAYDGYWSDAGTHETLMLSNNIMSSMKNKNNVIDSDEE